MIGQVLDHYVIEAQLGAGGMGVVYKAHDLRLQRAVAIKLLAHSTDDAARAILHEARAASALNHPHICTIYEVGQSGNQAYIVMEYVEGRSLRDLIPADGLTVDATVAYAIQIADAVTHAHDHGVVHRDLKTANIVITSEGRAKVLDFGLALRTSPVQTDQVATTVGERSDSVAGTLAYMPPEVLRGQPADARSDIWAIGVILYEMLTGRRPFAGRNTAELCSEILREPPWPLAATIDVGLRAVVSRCLMKERRQRYSHAMEVRAALEAIQRELESSTGSHSRVFPVRESFWRRAARPTLVTIVLILGLIAIAVAVPPTRRLMFAGSSPPVSHADAPADVAPTTNFEAHDQYLKGRNALRAQPNAEGARAAIGFYQEALRKDPKFALPYVGMSEAMLRLYRDTKQREWAEQAQFAADQARRIAPGQSEVHLALGAVYNATGKAPEAIDVLKRALTLSPQSDEAHRELGLAYAATGQGQEAIRSLRRAVEIDPYDWIHHNELGRVAITLGRFPEAIEAFRKVIELEPGMVRGYSNLAAVYLHEGAFEEAVDAFEKALKVEAHPSTYTNLGVAYSNTGRFADAVRMFEKSVELAPSESRMGNLADGYRWLGQHEKAKGVYDKAIALAYKRLQVNPRDAEAMANLAQYYAKRGDARQASQFITKARRIEPENVTFVYNEAVIHQLAGRTPEALQTLREAFRMGYRTSYAQGDPDLRPLRSNPEFQELVTSEK
jgi:tetratricopeptide (TPR) repeat protein/tRNA A-37 threonylcarbamoyl transferase component Bud32